MPHEERGSIPTHLYSQEIGLRSDILKPSKPESFPPVTAPYSLRMPSSTPNLFDQETRIAELPPSLEDQAKSHLRKFRKWLFDGGGGNTVKMMWTRSQLLSCLCITRFVDFWHIMISDTISALSEVRLKISRYRGLNPFIVSIGFDRKSHRQSVAACRLRNTPHESSLDVSPGSGARASLDQDVLRRLARQLNAELAKLTQDQCVSLVGFRMKLDREFTDVITCSRATGLLPLSGGWGVRTSFVSGSTRNEWSEKRIENPASRNVRLTMRNSTAPPNICFPCFYEMADL